MAKCYLSLLLVFFSIYASSQTYSGSGGSIPSNGTKAFFSIEIGAFGNAKVDTSFGVLSVCLNIMHSNDADVEAALLAPDGTEVTLTYANGGSGNNFTNTCFTDIADSSITMGTPPFTGDYRPMEFIGNVNNGQFANGTWKLMLRDLKPDVNSGMLSNWSITFGPHATPPYGLTSSNLPIVMINTYGASIPDDPKIESFMTIIDNPGGVRNYLSDPPAFTGHTGIEVRGSSSQQFPKKSYGLETWDAQGVEMDTAIMGMPSESDWILNANYTDKSFCRNVMAYQIFQNMGHYATRYRFCELLINGQYKGIYIFSEKIKRNKNRVDIDKLKPDENSGDALTGGYIIKIDKSTGSGGDGWTSSYPPPNNPGGQTIFFQYEYPKFDEITFQQKNYIKNYVYDFETALKGENFADTINGYRKYAVETTFIDYFIVNELSKNVDGYRLSTYLHKEKDSKGGKLRMGPVWDYDIAWHNANYCEGDVTSGWAYQFPCEWDTWQVPFWWSKLLTDPLFAERLNCRYNFLRQNILSNEWFDNYIDSIAFKLDEAQQRNFTLWPILGIYIWPNPWPYPPSYQGEISALKSWMHNRLTWLDNNMPGICTSVSNNENSTTNSFDVKMWPNPVTDLLTVEYFSKNASGVSMSIVNIQGNRIVVAEHPSTTRGMQQEVISTSDLPAGIYMLQITMDGITRGLKFIKTL